MPDANISVYADWGTTGLTYQLISGVGYRVVSGDPTLTVMQIPQRYGGMPVVEIGEYAFDDYTLLQSINIPYSVTTIGTTAFRKCTSLAEIYIPISVTYIGRNTFKNCFILTIYVEATSQPATWDSSWNSSSRPVIWGVLDY